MPGPGVTVGSMTSEAFGSVAGRQVRASKDGRDCAWASSGTMAIAAARSGTAAAQRSTDERTFSIVCAAHYATPLAREKALFGFASLDVDPDASGQGVRHAHALR